MSAAAWRPRARSGLSRDQNVSNAAGGAEPDERDDDACDLQGAASTGRPVGARRRQGLERSHRPRRPNRSLDAPGRHEYAPSPVAP
jgi:hypothetical protein